MLFLFISSSLYKACRASSPIFKFTLKYVIFLSTPLILMRARRPPFVDIWQCPRLMSSPDEPRAPRLPPTLLPFLDNNASTMKHGRQVIGFASPVLKRRYSLHGITSASRARLHFYRQVVAPPPRHTYRCASSSGLRQLPDLFYLRRYAIKTELRCYALL